MCFKYISRRSPGFFKFDKQVSWHFLLNEDLPTVNMWENEITWQLCALDMY
jgi:hypothetical protein